MNCTTCTDTYGEATDASDRRWRTLCSCERLVNCGRCKQRATHAFLDDDNEIDRFACDKHGVSAGDRAGIETVHGVKVVAKNEAPAAHREREKKTSGGVLVHIACRCGKIVYEGRDPTREVQLRAMGALKACSVCNTTGRRARAQPQ